MYIHTSLIYTTMLGKRKPYRMHVASHRKTVIECVVWTILYVVSIIASLELQEHITASFWYDLTP